MILAIYQDERIYEGNSNFLRAVAPIPAISKVPSNQQAGGGFAQIFDLTRGPPRLFREDSFDPTTRLRRGRFYVAASPSSRQWPAERINHFPLGAPVSSTPIDFTMEAFEPAPIRINDRGADGGLVLIGDEVHRTAWKIVAVERLFNGETLITLKAANTLGALPELNHEAIPAERRSEILSSFEGLADAAYRYRPVPIADVCRELVRLILAAWLKNEQGDLGKLISAVSEENVGVRSAATIISRLHSRGKSSERDKQEERGNPVRVVSDDDAEMAVSLVGFILRDVGWAK